MGRKLPSHTITTIRLDPDVMARVSKRAGSRGRSDFIRKAVEKLLSELDEEEAAAAEAVARVRAARAAKAKPD